MNISHFKRITLAVLAALAFAIVADAQTTEQSTSTLTRRQSGDRRRDRNEQTDGPKVTERMQAFYETDDDNNITDADRQWMRVIYRELDLDDDKNAALYYPEDITEGQENLFRIIMRLLANGQIKAYEYLDGREVFDEENEIKVGEMLDRFYIMHSDAKGSTPKSPRYTIHPSDVPTAEVLSYYIIEQWEFDNRTNKTRTVVKAICPVLHRAGDFGGEAVKYPMFWVKFADIRPWLSQQPIFIDDDNNLPSATYDDFFKMNMYTGDIYKTRNLKNKSMAQLYPDPDQRRRAQDSIQSRLENYDKNLWVPDREQVIAAKAKQDAAKTEVAKAADTENAQAATESTQTATEEKAAKRTTRRTPKKTTSKAPKIKETKIKTNNSSNAARSVRRRK